LFNGQSTTVITPIDATFNQEFAQKNPRVPVTRVDISGYGESVFSDWRNPAGVPPTISKVLFDVFIGRTSHEVVQLAAILYPYAVRVVRTITIERQNGAAVIRHDSGWQAASDGNYDYPQPGIVTHPGVVLGVVNVSNIRDLGPGPDQSAMISANQLLAVRFDCFVKIENCLLGQGPLGVPSRDQLGYVQILPVGQQLSAVDYAALLAQVGQLGGPVDCTLNSGGSGLRMRIARIGIAASSPATGEPQFAMAAWGSPVLPGGGQWSVVMMLSSDRVQTVDRDHGVPIIRQTTTPLTVPSPYRFSEPSDLLAQKPTVDYGILHSTGTQRVLFLGPKIETSTPFAITSSIPPILADPFALGTATGPFPRLSCCIPFNDANYQLLIQPGGNLFLQLPNASFTITTPPTIRPRKRVLRESQTFRTIVYANDENNNPSVVTVFIDTSSATSPWLVKITNLSFATECGSLGEIARVVGTMDSSSTSATQYNDSRMVFGPALQPVASLISFLEQFSTIPALGVSMTNELSLACFLDFNLPKYLAQISPAVKKFLEKFIADLDVKLLLAIASNKSKFEADFDVTLKFPTPFVPIVAIAIAGVKFEVSDEEVTWEFTLGLGIGIDFKVAGFGALAYYAETASLITRENVFGIASSALIKGSIDLEVVEVDISLEAKVELLKLTCTEGSAIWGVAQVTIAVEVSIFFVIDIEFDVQTEWTHKLDGGPCGPP
jgi:hypothetical protein